jgi:hypothetical protein
MASPLSLSVDTADRFDLIAPPSDFLARKPGFEGAIHISDLWPIVMDGFGPVWPATRTKLEGVSLGDAWVCESLAKSQGNHRTDESAMSVVMTGYLDDSVCRLPAIINQFLSPSPPPEAERLLAETGLTACSTIFQPTQRAVPQAVAVADVLATRADRHLPPLDDRRSDRSDWFARVPQRRPPA